MWRSNVNILRFTVAYVNATINVKPKTLNQRWEPTARTNPGKIRRLIGRGPSMACQVSVSRVLGGVWNQNFPVLRSKPRPLAGYSGPLLIPTKISMNLVMTSDIANQNDVKITYIGCQFISTNNTANIQPSIIDKLYTLIHCITCKLTVRK